MAKQVKKACGTGMDSKKKKSMKKATPKPKTTTKPTPEKAKTKVVNVRIGNGEPVLALQYMRNKQPKKG